MPTQYNFMLVWRSLFIVLVSLTIFLAWQTLPALQIETSLADVSPRSRASPETEQAIQTLQSSIEQRVILLVQGNDEDSVVDAWQLFRDQLSALEDITVLPTGEELAEKIISGLAAYRFSLLTAAQQQSLSERTVAEISQAAKNQLFSAAGGAQIFPFDKDPLGWHSTTFVNLLNASQTAISDAGPEQGYALSILLNIERGAMNMSTQERLSGQISRLAAQLEQAFEVKVERSGVFFFAADAAMHAKRDVSLISTGSILGVVLLLLFAFGSLRTLVLPIISILLGVGFAFLLTHSLYGGVHVLTIVFGASLIGIVIDYSLHYFYHQPSGPTRRKGEIGGALHRALLFSLMTSLIGYAALGFSDLQALQKVAVFSCCGLLMAWLSVICLGELATRRPVSLNQSIFPTAVDKLTWAVGLVKPWIWKAMALIVVVGAGLIIKLGSPFSDDPRVFFKPSKVLLASERQVAAVANDYEPGRYIIVNGESTAQIYTRHQALVKAIEQTPQFEMTDLSSLLAWIPSPEQQAFNYQRQALLYAEQGAAELLGQSLTGSSASVTEVQQEYRLAKDRIVTPDIVVNLLGKALPPLWIASLDRYDQGNIVNFVLIRKGINVDALAGVLDGLEGVEYVNTLERTSTALSGQRHSATRLLFFAYLLIGLLVMLRYRSLTSLWLVAVPVCASASLVMACWLSGVSLNLFHTMALFLVLGFGMDYTIFTKEMSRQSSRQRGLTLQAILLSAVTSLLSFGLLSISSIPVVASFGLTLMIGNLFNLLGVFIAAQLLSLTKTVEN